MIVFIGLICCAVGFLVHMIISSKNESDLKNKLTEAQTKADERNRENEILRNQAENDHKVIERLKPFEEKLETVKETVSTIEKARAEQYAGLKEQLHGVRVSEKELQESTKSLEGALKSTTSRGSWGEIELSRILELSGLKKNIDYVTQKTIGDENEKKPDVIVTLPGNKHIAIDAKTSMSSYFRAKELEPNINSDESISREYYEKVKHHISSIKKHIKDLHNKEYYKELSMSPDFTIMFMPSEAMLELALSNDNPSANELPINEYAAHNNILIATPTSLLGILKSVSAIWRYFEFAKDAQDLQKLGQDLFDSLAILATKMGTLGNSINSTNKNYNDMIASFEGNFLSKVKKIKSIDFDKLPDVKISKNTIREIKKPELLKDK